PYMDNELVRLLYQAPPHTRETNETSLRLISDLAPRLGAIPTDLGYGGDSASPSAAVRRLARYLQFKAEWYYNAGMPDWSVRFDGSLPFRLVEPLFLGSHKIDHYRLWFRNQLSGYLREMLTDHSTLTRPYLNSRGYRDMLDGHFNGRGNCLDSI